MTKKANPPQIYSDSASNEEEIALESDSGMEAEKETEGKEKSPISDAGEDTSRSNNYSDSWEVTSKRHQLFAPSAKNDLSSENAETGSQNYKSSADDSPVEGENVVQASGAAPNEKKEPNSLYLGAFAANDNLDAEMKPNDEIDGADNAYFTAEDIFGIVEEFFDKNPCVHSDSRHDITPEMVAEVGEENFVKWFEGISDYEEEYTVDGFNEYFHS